MLQEEKYEFIEQTQEGSVLSGLLNVPSDPSLSAKTEKDEKKKKIQYLARIKCAQGIEKISTPSLNNLLNYLLLIAKECAICLRHHTE